MKKNYENIQINVISLDDADVITASFAIRDLSSFLGGLFDMNGLDTQDFN